MGEQPPPDRLSGEVHYAVVEFPALPVRGDVLPALVDLVRVGVIRVLDLVTMTKDAAGDAAVVEIDELPEDAQEQFFELRGEYGGLLSEEDIERSARELSPGSCGVVLVWQNAWAARLSLAVRDAGGTVRASQPIPGRDVERALRAQALPAR